MKKHRENTDDTTDAKDNKSKRDKRKREKRETSNTRETGKRGDTTDIREIGDTWQAGKKAIEKTEIWKSLIYIPVKDAFAILTINDITNSCSLH